MDLMGSTKPRKIGMTRQFSRLLILALISVSLIVFYAWNKSPQGFLVKPLKEPPGSDHNYPPLFPQYKEFESRLPQHNENLPFPDGKHAKFIYNANHAIFSGWGNAMQELILNAHLAYSSQRSFVFDDYTWERDKDYSNFNGKLIPAKIPLSALITGPINGAPFLHSKDRRTVPRSVSLSYFRQVCPNPTILTNSDFGDKISSGEMLARWVKKLNEVDDPCVEISRDAVAIFSIWQFGSKNVLGIWPTLSKSPMFKEFGWSPLVMRAYEKNKHLIFPRSLPSFSFPSLASPSSPAENNEKLTTKIDGLIALHIRRGDFIEHCHHLANYTSAFNGFNQFPELPDVFEPPPQGPEWGKSTKENDELYVRRCFPSLKQIVDKVREVRREARSRGVKLDKAYFMTNAPKKWIGLLVDALRIDGRWEGEWAVLASSRDLDLGWEEKAVAQSIDMYIGQRAEVFIGNGFSSLTSNVVMMRMGQGFDPKNTRFW